MSKTRVKTILEKDEWSFYEFKEIVDFVFEKTKQVGKPGFNFNNFSEEIQADIDDGVANIKGLTERLVNLEDQFQKKLDEHYERTYKSLSDYHEKFSKLQSQADRLVVNLPDMPKVYGWDDYINMAERMAGMGEEQKTAFIELVDKLKK